MDRLAGKVAIVSGGATGMGGAASSLFAAEGAKVAVIDHNAEAAEDRAQGIRSVGGTALPSRPTCRSQPRSRRR